MPFTRPTRLPSIRSAALAAAVLALLPVAQAQLTVNSQTDLQQLARTITGSGVVISNPQITCHSSGYGEFQYSGSLLGLDAGILLTSGTIANAVGPNDEAGQTFQASTNGDATLNGVLGSNNTKDACKFEFDIIPAGDSLSFDFVFGSEEYKEYVGTQYNDVFGFFISGPGITGDPGIGSYHNIARVPVTNQAVAINNVNHLQNTAYYYDNPGGQYVQYDGFTRNLVARSPVQPCQTYHLKLVVADVADRKWDSGVFIAKVKSNTVTMEKFTQSGGPDLIEGCNSGWVRFTRQNPTPQPLVLTYYLQGSATNGTDYSAIGAVDPATPKTITIPANQASVDRAVNPLADGVNENTEHLLFILGNPNCPAIQSDTLVFDLLDTLNASLLPPTATLCRGDSVQFQMTGGQSWAWSPAAGLSAANVEDPWAHPTSTTTYTVTITEGSCSRSMSRQIKVSDLALSALVTQPLCAGATNGAINLSTSSGIAPYTYSWTGPNGFTASTQDLSNIAAGTYTVTVHDAVCERTQSFNVNQPAPLSVSLAAFTLAFGENIRCQNGADGEIDATVNGGTAPYTASWTGPNGFTSSSIDISGLRKGAYSLLITDAHGCTASASTTLVEPDPLVPTVTGVTHPACFEDGNGTISVSVLGGMPFYTYAWNTVPVQTGSTASDLSPGTYTVTVHDQYGCSATVSATVTGPSQPLTSTLTAKTDVKCFGNATGSATVSASGGTAPYTYAWNTTPAQNTAAASGLTAGTYEATITDAKGCTTVRSVTILQPAQALSSSIASQQDVNCFGTSTGSATVSATGGTGPYSYTWSTTPAQNTATASNLAAGTYTATVRDVNLCTSTVPVTIAQPAAALSATMGTVVNATCNGSTNGSATVNAAGGTAPYTYSWNTTPAQTSATATGLASGPYTVTVTDAKGCTRTANVTITQPAVLAISGSVSPALCQGGANGAIDATVTGGTIAYTYAWSGPSGFTAATQDISGLSAGGYTLTVTDANGCTATNGFDVNQPGLFAVSATLSTYGTGNVSCIGSTDGSIALTVTGATMPYGFTWSGPASYSSTSEDITGLAAGTYAVAISDANGCSTNATYTLAAPAAITVQLAPSAYNGGYAVGCNGGSNGTISTAIAGGNAPYTTQWSGPGGFTSTQSDLTGLAAGTYTVTVRDANNCTITQSITLTQPPALGVSIAGTVAQSCFGSPNGQATASITGGVGPYTYTWSTTPAQHGSTATGLLRGTYTISVTDANGCSASAVANVDGPTAPLGINIPSVTNVACFGGSTGGATAAATGGTAPYTYVWNSNPPTNSATVGGLTAGTWSVSVTDARGCTASRNVTITQPAAPLGATVLDHQPVTCYGNSDGSISIDITGGSGSYAVQWNTTPAQTGSTATGLAPGTYTATISDNNGCTQTLAFPVTVGGPTAPLAVNTAAATYAGGFHVTCPGATNGSINATVTGGTAPYTYSWTDGIGLNTTLEDLSAIGAGTYYLTVTDAHGCQATAQTTLNEPPPVTASATTIPAVCHGESSGAIDLTVTGGASPYTYSWSSLSGFTSTSTDLTDLAASVYQVVITDANGCSMTTAFDVNEPGVFNFNAVLSSFIGGNNVSCANANDGSIAMTAGGGTAPYQYHWTGPSAFTSAQEDLTGLAAGTYHLTLIDQHGCSALSTQVLTAPTPVSLLLTAPTHGGGHHVSCASATDGTIQTTVGGGIPGYTYAWTGPNGFTSAAASLTGLAAGTYQVTVSDANGCSRTSSITLTAPQPLASTVTAGSFASGNGISCAGATDGDLTLAITGGTSPITVAWTGPGGFTSSAWTISGLGAGSYSATITDGNGCTASANATLTAPAPLTLSGTTPEMNGHEVACQGGHDGSIDLSVTGGAGSTTYLWSGPNAFSSSAQDVQSLGAGTYTVTVSDINGCNATTSFTLDEPTPLQATAAITTSACQGANTGAIDLTVNGGVGGYTYLWTAQPAFGSASEDISALFAGVYNVTVTDANDCVLSTTYDVGQPGMFQISADLSGHAGGYNISCAGASDGSIDATVSGGTPDYAYVWSGPNGFGATTQDISGLTAGPYTLSITDANGCSAFAEYTLVAPTPISIGLAAPTFPGGNNTGCDGNADGAIDASVSGGVAPYSISWSGPNGPLGVEEDLSGLAAGTYTITVTDAVGCSSSNSITLTGPAGLSASVQRHIYPNGFYVTCANASDGMIDLTVTGGTQPYTIAWQGPNGFISSSEDITNGAAGTYTVLITDVNGCTTSLVTDLKPPLPLVLEMGVSEFGGNANVSCADALDGQVQAGVTGGMMPYSFAWTGPNGFASTQAGAISDLAAGSYSLTVTDAMGCDITANVTLTPPPALFATHTLSDAGFGYNVGCAGDDGSIAITVTGGTPLHQFDWSGPAGFASQNEDISGLVAGAYDLTVTDANGCILQRTITLTAPDTLEGHVMVTSNECDISDDGAIDLTILGGVAPYTQQWAGPGGFASSLEDLTLLASGDYTATVTDAMGCTTAVTAHLIAAAPINTTVYVSQYGNVNIACHGDTTGVIELALEGGFQPLDIAWTGPNGFVSTEEELHGLAAGVYTVTITDDHGCVVDSTITLTEPATSLNASLTAAVQPSGTNIACYGGSDGAVDLTVIGGDAPYIHNWRGPDSTAYSTEDIQGLVDGTYELVVTDANQCTLTMAVTLTQPDTGMYLEHSTSLYAGGVNTSCAGSTDGSISTAIFGGSPDHTFAWSGPGGFTSAADTISDLAAGTYTLLVTDINGCTLTQDVVLTAPQPIVPTLDASTFASGTHISCSGAEDGSIAAVIAGGIPTYGLSWSGPDGFTATDASLTGLAAGTYCLEVTDANQCSAQACVTLTAPATLTATATPSGATCDAANGAIDATIGGGSTPYATAWSSGAGTEDLANVPAGTYVLNVTDANGCTTSAQAVVTGTPGVHAEGTMAEPLCANDANGSIDLTVLTGSAPFAVLWNTSSTDEDVSDLPAGNYAVTVTDANGCTWNGSFLLQSPDPLTSDSLISSYADGFAVSTYGGSDGSIALTPHGGTAPYSYLWSTGATTATVDGLPAGAYAVTITDANGCSVPYMFVLDEPKDIEMPTGFTPNGDGQNDAFIIHGLEAYPNNQLTVINRWGNVVYERLNYTNDWRGENQQGRMLANGTYFAILRLGAAIVVQNYVDLRR